MRTGRLSVGLRNLALKIDSNIALNRGFHAFYPPLRLIHQPADRGGHPEPDRASWKKAHVLYLQAFSEPPNPTDKKKLGKLLKKPLGAELSKELFDYEAGFLKGLGRMSLSEFSLSIHAANRVLGLTLTTHL